MPEIASLYIESESPSSSPSDANTPTHIDLRHELFGDTEKSAMLLESTRGASSSAEAGNAASEPVAEQDEAAACHGWNDGEGAFGQDWQKWDAKNETGMKLAYALAVRLKTSGRDTVEAVLAHEYFAREGSSRPQRNKPFVISCFLTFKPRQKTHRSVVYDYASVLEHAFSEKVNPTDFEHWKLNVTAAESKAAKGKAASKKVVGGGKARASSSAKRGAVKSAALVLSLRTGKRVEKREFSAVDSAKIELIFAALKSWPADDIAGCLNELVEKLTAPNSPVLREAETA